MDLNTLIDRKAELLGKRRAAEAAEHEVAVKKEFDSVLDSLQTNPDWSWKIHHKENVKPFRDLGFKVRPSLWLIDLLFVNKPKWWVSVPDRK